MQASIAAAIEAIENASEIVEKSNTYNDRNNPFHNSAVAVYNRFLTMLIDLDGMEG